MQARLAEAAAKATAEAEAKLKGRELLAPDLRARWEAISGRHGQQKYFRFDWQYQKKARIIDRIGLDKVGRSLRVLDLGAGGGHFCHLLNRIGHRAVALNPGDEYFQALCKVQGVDLRIHHIKPCEPLPKDLGRFDVITAFAIKFNSSRKENMAWSLRDWDFLLNDLFGHHLVRDGAVHFSFTFREYQFATRPPDEVEKIRRLDAFLLRRWFRSPEIGLYSWGALRA